MDNQLVDLTLETVAGGAAVELFNAELEKVLQNIHDPNTDEKMVRVVRLEVRIKPTPDRESAQVLVSASSKVSASKPASDNVYLGMRNGRLVAVTRDPRQRDMFTPADDVLPLNRKKEQAK